jgi:predicted small lipoprotein YifL
MAPVSSRTRRAHEHDAPPTHPPRPAPVAAAASPAHPPRPAPATAVAALGALAALAALAALTGCGGRGAAATVPADGAAVAAEGRTPASAVAGAADTLVREGSSRVSTSMRMASGGTWVTISGTGDFDYAGGRGRLRLVLPRDAVGAQEHKPITELLMPGALYMKDRGEGVPDGKWVRVDTTRVADGNLVTGGATEPLAAAELLRGAADVAYAGEETEQGLTLRHYRGVADIARAAAAAPSARRGPLAAAAKGFTVTTVPFDVWLDAQGRPRRLTESFTYGPPAEPSGQRAAEPSGRRTPARGLTVVCTTSYDGFGAAVPVTLPRAADIWTGKIVSPRVS